MPFSHALLATSLLAALCTQASGLPSNPENLVKTRIERFSSGGRSIAVEVFEPAAGGSHPAVLVLHTSLGLLAGKGALEDFSRDLAEHGKVAFLVHYFDRTGTFYAGDKDIHELSPLWQATVRDAVGYASEHPAVDSAKIGIFGYSLGAFLAVAEGAADARIKAVAEVAGGVFDGMHGKIQRLPPILILHGEADRRVPVSNAHELQRLAGRLGVIHEVHLYEQEGHILSKPAMVDARRRALEFLDRHLAARPVSPAPRVAGRG